PPTGEDVVDSHAEEARLLAPAQPRADLAEGVREVAPPAAVDRTLHHQVEVAGDDHRPRLGRWCDPAARHRRLQVALGDVLDRPAPEGAQRGVGERGERLPWRLEVDAS